METKTKIKLKKIIRECLDECRREKLDENLLKALFLAVAKPAFVKIERDFYTKHPEAARATEEARDSIQKLKDLVNKTYGGDDKRYANAIFGGDKKKVDDFLRNVNSL